MVISLTSDVLEIRDIYLSKNGCAKCVEKSNLQNSADIFYSIVMNLEWSSVHTGDYYGQLRDRAYYDDPST